MQITTNTSEGRHELTLLGRFDANWADSVGQAIETAIRGGNHQVDLDFSKVDYISSAGIRILIKYSKQLKAARGSLRVVRPGEFVLSVLQKSGLAEMLVAKASSIGGGAAGKASAISDPSSRWAANGVEFEAHELQPGSTLNVYLRGVPDAVVTGQASLAQTSLLHCGPDVLAVGLGGFGSSVDDVKGRFGECLAVGGSAITLPTDGSSVPDYQISEGQHLPELQLLYGISATGNFSRLIRFEASRSERRVISLADLVQAALHNIQASAAGFAILAESSSIIGAWLQRSPALASGRSPLSFPEVRDWISFTTERSEDRNAVLIVGFAELNPEADSGAFLRPVGPGTQAKGHFHAAVFPYRPLPKGRLELRETVAQILSSESARTVLHLMADEREFEGVGQTDLMRGACWIAPAKILGRAPAH